MNIMMPRAILGNEEMDPNSVKLYSVLLTRWRYGKFSDYVMPTVKELQGLLGITDKPITKAINTLKQIRVKDRYQQSFPLLRISTKPINGIPTKVYRLALPEAGELTDPTCFSKDGGGSATMSAMGGYIFLSDEIQRLGLTINDEIVLAVWNNIASFEGYNYPVYNAATPHKLGLLKHMSFDAVKRATYKLYRLGYLWHSEQVRDKSWGWKKIAINLSPNKDAGETFKEVDETEMETDTDAIDEINDIIQEDTDMDTNKLMAMIDKAMDMGNTELAMKLTEKLPGPTKPENKPEEQSKKAENKPKKRKSDLEEMDYENDYIRIWLSVPKNISKNPTVNGMIDGVKDSVAWYWRTEDDVEASGYIDAFGDYGIKMSVEVLQEITERKEEPMTYDEVISASRSENNKLYAETEADRRMDELMFGNDELGDISISSAIKEKPEPKVEEKIEAPKPEEPPKKKEWSPETIALMEIATREGEETRKQRIQQIKEEVEADLEWLASQI